MTSDPMVHIAIITTPNWILHLIAKYSIIVLENTLFRHSNFNKKFFWEADGVNFFTENWPNFSQN